LGFEVLLPIGIRLSKRIPILDVYAPWLLLLGSYGGIFVAAFVACDPTVDPFASKGVPTSFAR